MIPSHHFAPPPAGSYVPYFVGGPVYHQQQQQQQSEVRPLNRYDGDTSRSSPSHDARLPADDVQLSNDVTLHIRQQPKEALVTLDGKEKARKPVDPPPIIQLKVRTHADPQGHFMQSPYLIMIADLWHPENDEANPDKSLAGTICSSLHRLKDVDNKGNIIDSGSDGAFFVFGDISIKQQGEHRLRFSLFDIHKPGNMYEFVTHIISEKFKVVSQKDFHGMDESTYLSRAFSDQGVRLRLRKEPRHVMGRKRSPPQQQSFDQPQYQTPTPTGANSLAYPISGTTYSGYGTHGDASPVKRQRIDDESSPRYSASQVSSSPSAQMSNRQGNYPVQSPSSLGPPISSGWANNLAYGSNYSLGRGMLMNNTSAAGELSNMAPPPLSSTSISLRPQYQTSHTSGAALPSFSSRTPSLLEGFSDDAFNLGASHHDRQSDNHTGTGSHLDYSGHTTDGIRGLPVQSPEQSLQLPRSDFTFQAPSMSGGLLSSYEGSGSRAGSIGNPAWQQGMQHGVPMSRYEERCDRARSQYHVNPLQDGYHGSPQANTGYDNQYKHEDHHFKAEGQ